MFAGAPFKPKCARICAPGARNASAPGGGPKTSPLLENLDPVHFDALHALTRRIAYALFGIERGHP